MPLRSEIIKKITGSTIASQVDLKNLNIKDNDVPGILAELIKTKPDVEMIFLGANQIGDKGVEELCAQLASFKKLSFVDLSENKLTVVGARTLVEFQRRQQPHSKLEFYLFGNALAEDTMVNIAIEMDSKMFNPKP